jgi:hypothetical protein
MPEQSQRHVSGTAAGIENGGLGLRKNGVEATCGAAPPEAVDVAGKDMIQQIVARGDAVEHLPYGIR